MDEPPHVPREARFAFGENWSRFLKTVDEPRIARAVESLQQMLGRERLDGQRFLDVGSGSGLFSLAAHRLGAAVHSFDYDPQSVACTREMQRRFGSGGAEWTIEQGSALDAEYLAGIPPADIVYAWGVLHHTGELWRSLELVAGRVASGGMFYIAIYNDQGAATRQWTCVKRLYQKLPRWLRPLLVGACGAAILMHRLWEMLWTMLLKLIALENPLAPARQLARAARRQDRRGMHRWYDLVDWVGGWPFEAARPEEVLRRLRPAGFELLELHTCAGLMGCNEFLFRRGCEKAHELAAQRLSAS